MSARVRKPNRLVAALAAAIFTLTYVAPAFPQAPTAIKVYDPNTGTWVPARQGSSTGSVLTSDANNPTSFHYYRTNAVQARLNGGNTAQSGILDLTGANNIMFHILGTADSATGRAVCLIGLKRISAASLNDTLNAYRYFYRDTMITDGNTNSIAWSDTVGVFSPRDTTLLAPADTVAGIGEIPCVIYPATVVNRGISIDLKDRAGRPITAGLCVVYVRMAKFWTGNPSWLPINPYTSRSASIQIDVEGTR